MVAFVVVVVRCSFKLGKETWIGANFSQLDISCCAQGKTRPGRQRNKLFQLHQSLAAGRLLINMTHEPVCCSVPIKANVSLISATIRRNGQHLSRLLELIMASFCSNYNEKERERDWRENYFPMLWWLSDFNRENENNNNNNTRAPKPKYNKQQRSQSVASCPSSWTFPFSSANNQKRRPKIVQCESSNCTDTSAGRQSRRPRLASNWHRLH